MKTKKLRREPEAVSFSQARDEMFSHILRCGVIDALPEHQKERFSRPVQRKTEAATGAA
jgi:hypothetical protein